MNASREDYLLTIYRLTAEEAYTNSISVARFLRVSRASVSEMIKKLVEDGFVSFRQNRLSLTEEGRHFAKSLVSTHRIWESFLVDRLHMSLEEAHKQADLLEHVTGPELKERLNRYLGQPEESPSGRKIWDNLPGEEGK